MNSQKKVRTKNVNQKKRFSFLKMWKSLYKKKKLTTAVAVVVVVVVEFYIIQHEKKRQNCINEKKCLTICLCICNEEEE